ncbi:POC1 centriolar protein homolog A [Ischnura elegans]|uniref:POC1 centriolar protein homolog A n=1 Tax=Ischnura elegans TaxID=197161 RepID=UPI001ED8AC40|nr:POC1 centriolar protein homolog A [Ischnura elegans]
MQTEDPSLEHHFRGHRGAVTCLAFNPQLKQLASGGKDSTLMLWNFKQTTRSFRFLGHKDSVLDICYSPSGHLLASASADRTVRLWTPTLCGNSSDFHAHTSAVRSVHFSPNGQYFVTSSNDKSVKVWSVARRNRFVSSMSGHGNWVRCARFSPDGRLIASCSDDHTTRLHDIRENGSIGSPPVHIFTESRGCPQKVAFLPSGTCIAVAMSLVPGDDQVAGGAIKIYDIRSQKLIQYYACQAQGQANDAAFHPSGSYLAAGFNDATVKIMDLLNGVLIYTLQGHIKAVSAVAFSANGDYLATGGDDNHVLVWRTKFDHVVESLCSKVTIRDPKETKIQKSPNFSSASSAHDKNNGKLTSSRNVDARESVLNPTGQEIEITDVSSSRSKSDQSDVEILEEKKASRKDPQSNEVTSHHVVTNGSGDHNDKESKTDHQKCSESCFHMQKVMTTLLNNMNEQIEAMRQTVVLLEQRMTIIEDQLQGRESFSSS